jgi:hypothetical protein
MKSGDRHDVFDPDKVAVGGKQIFLYSGTTGRMAWLKVEEIELVYVPRHKRA